MTIDDGIDMRHQVAWCWATGLIEIGDAVPADEPDGSGPIKIAEGPKAELITALEVLARHGKGASRGKLLVPGVPKASNQVTKCDALIKWLVWCRKDGRHYRRVRFTRPNA